MHRSPKLTACSILHHFNLFTLKKEKVLPAKLDSVNMLTSSRQQSSLNSRCCCDEELCWPTSSLGAEVRASSGADWAASAGTEMRDSSRDRHSAQVSESSTWSPFRRESMLRLGDWLLDSRWGRFKLPWFERKNTSN